MTLLDPIRFQVAPGFPPGLETALAGSGLIRVDADADVWVTLADLPRSMLRPGPALVVVGTEANANVGWLEEDVERWVEPDEFARDGAEIVRRALASRLALRPAPHDPPDRWLEAVRVHSRSDAAGRITPDGDAWTGSAEGLEPLGSFARKARSRVVISSAAALRSKLGLSGLPADGVVALPLGPRASDGVLLLVVAADGDRWSRDALPAGRAVVDAAWRASLQRRLTAAEGERGLLAAAVTRMLSLFSHDLRSPLFAVQLGIKVLERQGSPPSNVAVLHRAATSASDLLRRMVQAGRAVFDPVPIGAGTADVAEVWSRVAAEIANNHPARTIVGPEPALVGPVRVGVDAAAVELLIRTVLQNAAIHAARDATVRVDVEIGEPDVRVVVRNAGRLPFADLASIEPFEHRANGGLGVGLFLARRVADAASADLSVRQVGGDVEARIALPR